MFWVRRTMVSSKKMSCRGIEARIEARLFYIFCIFVLISSSTVHASDIPYADIPFGAWYVEEVQSFINEGYLDESQSLFRAGDRATRAEFIKLVVELNGGILDEIPPTSAFNDVHPGDWFFGYMEESAREDWTRGDGNCYGNDVCFVRPHDSITRAEAAVLAQRAFGKKRLGKAPAFSDNPSGNWFTNAVQTMADHCILRGDDEKRTVRPHDPINRAEMVTMLYRVDNGGKYPKCR